MMKKLLKIVFMLNLWLSVDLRSIIYVLDYNFIDTYELYDISETINSKVLIIDIDK